MINVKATPSQWVFNRILAYARLVRVHKPVGIFLLMWPMLIALWVASLGQPSFKIVVIFLMGCFLMRSAGCAINDFADRHFDGKVTRTQNRPLPQKQIKPFEAVAVFGVLSALAFILVLCTNTLTIYLSFVGLLLAWFYPFIKRLSHGPQLFLGLSFAWAIPMSYAAVAQTVPYQAWVFYLATILWAISYDTQYALADIQDDKRIGVKSTAIFLGQWVNLVILGLGVSLSALILLYAALSNVLGPFIILSVLAGLILIGYQQKLLREHDAQKCFKAFLSNQWLGALWFLGFFCDLTLHTAFIG